MKRVKSLLALFLAQSSKLFACINNCIFLPYISSLFHLPFANYSDHPKPGNAASFII